MHPLSMKLCVFQIAALAVATSADLSVLKFRTGDKASAPVEITWDGTTLKVPQLCRASECAALASVDAKQAARNGDIAESIAAVSARAQDNSKGLAAANEAVIKQDEANQAKFDSYATSIISHGERQREDFASDDASITNALKLEIDARKKAVLSLETFFDEDTKALRQRHATLEKELLKAVERLNTFENVVALDVSSLKQVDLQNRVAEEKLAQESRAADAKVEETIAELEVKLEKQHEALVAVDAALHASDTDALVANAAAHKALRALDNKLEKRIAAAEAKYDHDIAVLEANDRTLIAADKVNKDRVKSLGLDMEARDGLLATMIDKAISDHDDKIALLKLKDIQLNEAGNADKKSLMQLAEKVVAEDDALAKRIAELKKTHDTDIAALKVADTKFNATDAVAKNILMKDFYIAQAAQTNALRANITGIRASHRTSFDSLVKKITELQATDRGVVADLDEHFDGLDKAMKDFRIQHDGIVAELLAADADISTANAALSTRHHDIDLKITKLNADLATKIKEASDKHGAMVKELMDADRNRGAVSTQELDALAKSVTEANEKLDDTIDMAERAHATAVQNLVDGDTLLKQADVDAEIQADALNITFMAQNSKLLQRLEALKASHAAAINKLELEDQKLVQSIIKMTRTWEHATAVLGTKLEASVEKDSIEAAAKLEEASGARARIRKEIKDADNAFVRDIEKVRNDFKRDVDKISDDQATLATRLDTDNAAVQATYATQQERISKNIDTLEVMRLRIAKINIDLAEELREARREHDIEVERAMAAEAGNTKLITETIAKASSSNDELEQRVNDFIASAAEANEKRHGKLLNDLDDAEMHLRRRMQNAEDTYKTAMDKVMDDETYLDDKNMMANFRLDSLKLRLASEDAKLQAKIEAEATKRQNAVKLLQIADQALVSTDQDTQDRLAELRATFLGDFATANSALSSSTSKLDRLTQDIDELDIHYQAKIKAVEAAAASDNDKLERSIKAIIDDVDVASRHRDEDLASTATEITQAIKAAAAALRVSTQAASVAMKDTAKANNEEVEAKKSLVLAAHSSRTEHNLAQMQKLHSMFSKTTSEEDDKLSAKIKNAVLNAEDEIMIFSLSAYDQRAKMAEEVRHLSQHAKIDAQTADDRLAIKIDDYTKRYSDLVAEHDSRDVELHNIAVDEADRLTSSVQRFATNVTNGASALEHVSADTEIDLNQRREISDAKAAGRFKLASDEVVRLTRSATDSVANVRSHKDDIKLQLAKRQDALDQNLELVAKKEKQMQSVGDAEVSNHAANQLSSFNTQVDAEGDEFNSSLDQVQQSENSGNVQVDLKIQGDLKAKTDAATKKFSREASRQLELEAQNRKAEDDKLIIATTDAANIERNEIQTNHQGLREQLDIIHATRDAEIKKAKREHDDKVAALLKADGELAAAIVTRVDAAETRIHGQERDQNDRVSELLRLAKQKSEAADTRAAELLKNLQEQSNAILGVGNPSTAACEAATIGLCNVRDQLHGGVAGTCDPTRSSGGWCSFRCNNGVFRGEDGCKAN